MGVDVRAVLAEVAAMGLLRAVVPQSLGGTGRPSREAGAMLGDLAPRYGFTAFQVVAKSLASAGTAAAQRDLLPGLMDGSLLGCAAISEPEIGSDAGHITCRAERKGDRYILNGTKTWVLCGQDADIANTMAVTDPAAGSRGISRMLVPLGQPGVVREPIPMSQATRLPMTTLHFHDVEAPAEYLLGEEGRGLALTLRGLESSRAAVASQAVGLARAALQAARQRALERHQFGKPVASFQLVQAILAKGWAATEAAALLADRAWDAIDSGEDSTRWSSAAKFHAVETAITVTQQCMEVFGAAGVRDDVPVGQWHHFATGLAAPDGTLQVNQLILGRELTGISAFV